MGHEHRLIFHRAPAGILGEGLLTPPTVETLAIDLPCLASSVPALWGFIHLDGVVQAVVMRVSGLLGQAACSWRTDTLPVSALNPKCLLQGRGGGVIDSCLLRLPHGGSRLDPGTPGTCQH